MSESGYIIRGGVEGRERLRLLSDVMGVATREFLQSLELQAGARCLDLGCGGGDVSFELARRVGPAGCVLGVDRDATKLQLARDEARKLELANLEFERADLRDWRPKGEFDLIYARFVVSHLPDPVGLLRRMRDHLAPAGRLALEDIDFRAHFCEPPNPAMDRYVALYTRAVRRRGGDANIGPRLPALLREAGYAEPALRAWQPVAMTGGIKLLSCVTMETITGGLVEDGLASEAEARQVLDGMVEFANDPHSVHGGPRICQAWALVARGRNRT